MKKILGLGLLVGSLLLAGCENAEQATRRLEAQAKIADASARRAEANAEAEAKRADAIQREADAQNAFAQANASTYRQFPPQATVRDGFREVGWRGRRRGYDQGYQGYGYGGYRPPTICPPGWTADTNGVCNSPPYYVPHPQPGPDWYREGHGWAHTRCLANC